MRFRRDPGQFVVLNILCVEEGWYQRELADRTFKDKPIIRRRLYMPEKKGLPAGRPARTTG